MPMRPHSGGKKSLDIKLSQKLYWNPCVTIDGHQDGTTSFDFYASDARDTRYIINIEGIASDGTPFKATRTIDKR